MEWFRDSFADQPTRALEAVLPATVLARAVEEHVGSHRQRLYPPLMTLGLFVGQALSSDGACQEAVARRLSERCGRGEPGCSLSSGPYCKARQRLPLGLIESVVQTVGDNLERASPEHWKWRGRSVKLVDGTTVSMPDTASNQARYPQSRAQKAGLGFPLAMLVAIISLSTGAVMRWAKGPCRGKETGEQALFRGLIPELDRDDIIVADRFHCNYFTVALLRERGVDMVTRQHQLRHTDFRRGKRLGRGDHVVEWLRPPRPAWMDEPTYARMPERLSMRESRIGVLTLVSTLVDGQSVSREELAALYRRRWQVEVDLRSIKAELGMDILRAKSADMIDKEIAVYLLAYNLICALMSRAAAGVRVLARALSFKGTVQMLLAFQQSWRHAGGKQIAVTTAYLLGGISALRLPVRPQRVEPRAIKRRPKNHRLLTVPRGIARAAIIASYGAR